MAFRRISLFPATPTDQILLDRREEVLLQGELQRPFSLMRMRKVSFLSNNMPCSNSRRIQLVCDLNSNIPE
jgi:hypothetical protein